MMTDVVEVIVQTNTVEVISGDAAVIEVIEASERLVEVVTAGPQGPAGDGGVSPPAIPAFTDQTDVVIDTLTESNAVTVAGDAETVWPAVVRGDGSPEMRVNSGAWGPSGIFRAGDSLRLRLMSSGDALAARIATLYAQGVAIDWSVTTASGAVLFVPVGSDSLITSDGLTFKVVG